jgi:hypothetical protein
MDMRSRVETLLFEVSLDVWHMCLRVETVTAWSYTTCVSETRAQQQLQVALDVWHVFLSWNMDCWKVNLQSWTRQVELNHRLLEVVLYHCTCVLELKHWLLDVVLPVSLDVWHVFVRCTGCLACRIEHRPLEVCAGCMAYVFQHLCAWRCTKELYIDCKMHWMHCKMPKELYKLHWMSGMCLFQHLCAWRWNPKNGRQVELKHRPLEVCAGCTAHVFRLKHRLLEVVLHVHHKQEPEENYKLQWMFGMWL